MSNDFYNYGNTLIPGDLARAEDVANEFIAAQSGFDKLPKPRSDVKGFAEVFHVEPATEATHAATWGQLKEIEAEAEAHRDAAQAAQALAETAQQAAEDAEDGAVTAKNGAEAALASLNGEVAAAAESAAQALASKNLAADWASKAVGQTVDGAGTRSALHYADLAKQWAEAGYGVNVEGTQKSAKHWAIEAQAIVSGARQYIGHWDASGGTMPIASPTVGDAGKYWIITVGGTLPVVGAVGVGWELAINDDLDYQAANLTAGMVTSVNGKTGPTVTLTPADIGAAASSHSHSEYLQKADNLAALTDKPTARTNLGLGTASTLNFGTGSGQVPVRDSNGNIPGNITGAALTATSANRLTSAVPINVTGDVSGTTTADLSGPVSLVLTVADDSHNHSAVASMTAYAAPFDSGNRNPRDYFDAGLCAVFVKGGTVDPASGWPVNYGKLLNIPGYRGDRDGGAMQILVPYGNSMTANGRALIRTGSYDSANEGWSSWTELMDKDLADGLYLGKSEAAASATRLATGRTITLTGDATGVSPSFNGTANISINVTIPAATLLTKIKTVDGASSGLDADTLDGLHASSFARSDAVINQALTADTWTTARTLTLNGDITEASASVDGSANVTIPISIPAATLLTKIKTVDGPASGLDADTLDGFEATAFMRVGDTAARATTADRLTTGRTVNVSGDVTGTAQTFDGLSNISIPVTLSASTVLSKLLTVDGPTSGIYAQQAASGDKLTTSRTISLAGDASGSVAFDGSANVSLSVTLNAAQTLTRLKTVDGSGSGLDADLLDGLNSTDFVQGSALQGLGLQTYSSVNGVTSVAVGTAFSGDGLYLVTVGNTSIPSETTDVLFPYHAGRRSSASGALRVGAYVFAIQIDQNGNLSTTDIVNPNHVIKRVARMV